MSKLDKPEAAVLYQAELGNATMALVGDTMLSRALRPYGERDYLELAQLLRSADVTFANLETTVRESHEGTPNFTQGTPMSTPPSMLGDLKWMGIDMVSVANNHATDYSTAGVLATMRHLEQAGLPFSGAGRTLMEARRPAYFDSPAGRVALISATSFFRPWNRAADSRPDSAGRPGINPLGFSTSYTVDDAAFQALRRISDELGMTQERMRQRGQFYSPGEVPTDGPDSASLLGARFHRGTAFGTSTQVDADDAEANLHWIREARKQADWVIFSFHNHEFGEAGKRTALTDVELDESAQFMAQFAHAAIDAGAHVVAGHGPHVTMGAEIYKGLPIFYSLGNFIFQNETIDAFPAEAYGRFGLSALSTPSEFLDARTGNDTRGFPASPQFWESLVAVCEFFGKTLSAVRLVPLDLGYGRPRAQRGRPMLARGKVAAGILGRFERLSRPFGTRIEIEGECGVLRLQPQAGQ